MAVDEVKRDLGSDARGRNGNVQEIFLEVGRPGVDHFADNSATERHTAETFALVSHGGAKSPVRDLAAVYSLNRSLGHQTSCG